MYLGIHWFIDIPLGLLIGGVGALFIHHLQPRLRNDYGSFFKGFNKLKIKATRNSRGSNNPSHVHSYSHGSKCPSRKLR